LIKSTQLKYHWWCS